MRRSLGIVLSALGLALLGLVLAGAVWSDGLPLFPTFYRGTVTLAGQPAPDGLPLVARIANYQGKVTWESEAVTTVSGGYAGIVVSPNDRNYLGGTVTFHTSDGLQARETSKYLERAIPTTLELNLSFEKAPRPGTRSPLLPSVGDPAVPLLPLLALGLGSVAVTGGLLLLRSARRAT